MIITCFECEKYCPIRNTTRHRNALDCDHDKYNYAREKSWVHGDMDEVSPELKDFSATAYPRKNKLVYPLSALKGGLFDVDVGDTLTEEPEGREFPRVPEEIEVTGLVRYWDRIELFYEEAETA